MCIVYIICFPKISSSILTIPYNIYTAFLFLLEPFLLLSKSFYLMAHLNWNSFTFSCEALVAIFFVIARLYKFIFTMNLLCCITSCPLRKEYYNEITYKIIITCRGWAVPISIQGKTRRFLTLQKHRTILNF